MLKILEIGALFLVAQLLSSRTPVLESNPVTDFVASKGRTLILALVGAFILVSLFTGGIFFAIVGTALWASMPTLTSLYLIYIGLALAIASGITILFAFSRNRFQRMVQPDRSGERRVGSPLASNTPQVLEEIFSALIKDLMREKPSTTAASSIHPHPA